MGGTIIYSTPPTITITITALQIHKIIPPVPTYSIPTKTTQITITPITTITIAIAITPM